MTLFPVGAAPGVNISETLLDDVTGGACYMEEEPQEQNVWVPSDCEMFPTCPVPVSLSYCNGYEAGLCLVNLTHAIGTTQAQTVALP